jgi:integrase
MSIGFFVFKAKRRKNGKLVESRVYSGRIKLDGETRYRQVPLNVTDRRVAEQKLALHVKELEREACGMSVPRIMREALQAPLPDHVTAFLRELEAKGRAVRTVKSYRNILHRVFASCGWKVLRDLNPRAFCEWRQSCGLKPKTINDALGTIITLCNWLERQGMMPANPFRHVEKVTNDNVGTYRRALSADEVQRLLTASPPGRSWIYLFIVYTGLRRNEMNRITRGHIFLDAPQPYVELLSSMTKNRKPARQPLRPEAVAVLREKVPDDLMPYEWVFRGKVPSVRKFKVDLAAAGISPVDERGRVLDVHALRTTFGTMLSVAGVSPRVAMELMRHSDLKLTMRIYTDAAQLPLASDVQRLPSFSASKSDTLLDALNDAQTGVLRGRSESEPVAESLLLASKQVPLVVPFSPAQSVPDSSESDLKMVGAARFELATSTSRT